MIQNIIKSVLGGVRRDQQTAARAHLQSAERPGLIYAIGDVHGCIAELQELEAMIANDRPAGNGERWIVYLGDYIDRGPDSAGVIEHLLSSPPNGFRRICLAGNHETMMLGFMDNPRIDDDWLRFGGLATLSSYGFDPANLESLRKSSLQAVLSRHIPEAHLNFMRQLPYTLSVPGLLFVHAGIRHGTPIHEQSEQDLLWIRDEFFQAEPTPNLCVVHGHTPVKTPLVTPSRIDIDTRAYSTGVLSAVCLSHKENPRILQTAPKHLAHR